MVTGKPAPVLANLKDTRELKLLPVPYAKELEDSYYPATLTHDDYPELIAEGKRVDTVAVCAVLVSFNWTDDGTRSRKIGKFVDAFFDDFDQFLKASRHPKWREVNFAATLEGWHRAPAAQIWIDQAKRNVAQAGTGAGGDAKRFDTFLAQASPASGAPLSDAERAKVCSGRSSSGARTTLPIAAATDGNRWRRFVPSSPCVFVYRVGGCHGPMGARSIRTGEAATCSRIVSPPKSVPRFAGSKSKGARRPCRRWQSASPPEGAEVSPPARETL